MERVQHKKKKGILVVSFGTSHLDTMEKTVAAIEQQIQETYREYVVYRAFTSGMIIKKLKKEAQISIPNVTQALHTMWEDQIETVIVQPTHIINGIENDKMIDEVMQLSNQFKKVRIGKPLLSSVEDYKRSIHSIMEQVEISQDEALVFMGHGTDHHANSAYPMLEYTFHALGYTNVLVGTVEGFPDLKLVINKLEISEMKRVTLMPFMVVAGDHAKNDMAGEEDSWKTELEKRGFQVRVILKGLGEFRGIRNIFVEHISEAME
ncbi:MAG: sirohydrochlorin cobaltochelatase [Lachnospiraceae bacterium]